MIEQVVVKIVESLTKPESLVLLAWVLYLVNDVRHKDETIKEMLVVDRERNSVLSELTTLIKSLLYSSKGGAL